MSAKRPVGIAEIRESLARLEEGQANMKLDLQELKTRVEPAIQAGRDAVSRWKGYAALMGGVGLAGEIILRLVR